MFTHHARSRSVQNWLARPTALALILLVGGSDQANSWQSPEDVVKVEEDWEVQIGQADTDIVAPYVTTVISPVADSDVLHCLFALNPRDESENLLGGTEMVIKLNGETIGDESTDVGQATTLENETITWTMRMTLGGNHLAFEVVDGTSDSWGTFGGLETHFTTNIVNLNGYSPEVSVESSGVGYASYRVQTLVLKRVRRYLADGQVLEDNTERVVHPR